MSKYVLKTPNGPRPAPKPRGFTPWQDLSDKDRLEALEIVGNPALSDFAIARQMYEWAMKKGQAPFVPPKTYKEWSDLAGFKWDPKKTRQSNKMTEMWMIKRLKRVHMEANVAARTGKKPKKQCRPVDRRIFGGTRVY